MTSLIDTTFLLTDYQHVVRTAAQHALNHAVRRYAAEMESGKCTTLPTVDVAKQIAREYVNSSTSPRDLLEHIIMHIDGANATLEFSIRGDKKGLSVVINVAYN